MAILTPDDAIKVSHSRTKRSRNVRLTTMTAVVVTGAVIVSGCEPAVDPGPPTQVQAYANVAECVALSGLTESQCSTAESQAKLAATKEAPRFEDSTTCEETYGQGQCVPRSGGGQSFFTPLITGFMIGQLLNGGGNRYAPLYRQRNDGKYYTGSGYGLGYSNSAGRYTTGTRALEVPRAAPRVQSRASVVSRGGFGGKSGGGWGG